MIGIIYIRGVHRLYRPYVVFIFIHSPPLTIYADYIAHVGKIVNYVVAVQKHTSLRFYFGVSNVCLVI